MLIQCTKKLLKELNINEVSNIEEEPLISWHANLIIVNRRKTVVLVNDKNRYIIVLYGLKAKDFKKLNQITVNAIIETFQEECIKGEIIEQFIKSSNEVIFGKTKNRSMISKMNQACDLVYFNAEMLNKDFISQTHVSIDLSKYYQRDKGNKLINPNEVMYEDLEKYSNKSIFSCEAIEFRITLDLENHNVWRKIIVPNNITFRRLHMVLRTAFGWQDYHLHDFIIYDECNPVVNLVCDKEAFEYPNELPMKLETEIKLSEYIPRYKKIKYTYDFGDNWQHYIQVERIIENYPKNNPICIEGEGNAPPEDVGGEYGYDEFLQVISDANHPECEDMLSWGIRQGYEDFDINKVNNIMKSRY